MRTPLAVAALSLAAPAVACACVPPPGFVDTPPPAVDPARLVAHTEQVTIHRPLAVVVAEAEAEALEDAVQRGGALPHVTGTHPLTPGPFGAPRARRLVCLSDGSTLREQVLEVRREPKSRRFRYVVWGYTTQTARPIRYGVGDFLHSDIGEGRTRVRWPTPSSCAATASPARSGVSAAGYSARPSWSGTTPR